MQAAKLGGNNHKFVILLVNLVAKIIGGITTRLVLAIEIHAADWRMLSLIQHLIQLQLS